MLYNHEMNLRTTEERIRNSKICEANKQLIFEYESYCFAEGLKIARVLKHLYELKMLAELFGKEFNKASKQDVMKVVGDIERNDRSESTKRDYKILIRKFFRWMEKDEVISWMKIPTRNDTRKLPEDMLSEEEIEKMINACEHPRDRALVASLYESGARISELGNLKVKHVKFDQYGAVLMVDGKTGMRRVRIIFSSPYLAIWLENHPFRSNPEAFVWVGIGTVGRNEPMVYGAIRMHLKRIAEKAGIKKRIHPHLFRHSRSTHLAKHLTEAQMKQYLGWVQGSDMAAIYVHLSGRDVDNALLRMHGIITEETKDVQMSPKQCTRCSTMNSPTTKFCSKCGLALDIKTALEIEEKSSNVTMDFMQAAKRDPKIVDLMKMLLQSVSTKV
jgi:integrase/ribosomal protein L40E